MSNVGTVHIIGAGLAGLSAAVHLAKAGRKVVLYEAGSHAGGRCRSYYDSVLDTRIDNGNHLMLACNEAALEYLDITHALATLYVAQEARFSFIDVVDDIRWELKINEGRFPKWVFNAKARVAGTRWWDYLEAQKLLTANRYAKVTDVLDTSSVLYRRFWAPMCVSIMNTAPHEASAQMLGQVFNEAFAQGGIGARPMLVREGLSESFVEPALAYLKSNGADMRFGTRLRELKMENDQITALHFAGEDVVLDKWDWVVLAVPAPVMNTLLPALPTPTEFRSIVNAHYKLPAALNAQGDVPVKITGVIGGMVEWVFEKGSMLSTTTSAAEVIVDKSAEEIAALLWRDVAHVYGQDPTALPPYRIVKEKRATFAATPEQIMRRPKPSVRHTNLTFCGDWTNTGLPSTIEGSIRSGRMAAGCIVASINR